MSQTRLQYLLGKLAEEACEVAQMANKTKDFGFDEVYETDSNKQRLHSEINDMQTIIEMLNYEFQFEFIMNQSSMLKKVDKVNKYYEYSKSLGLAD